MALRAGHIDAGAGERRREILAGPGVREHPHALARGEAGLHVLDQDLVPFGLAVEEAADVVSRPMASTGMVAERVVILTSPAAVYSGSGGPKGSIRGFENGPPVPGRAAASALTCSSTMTL